MMLIILQWNACSDSQEDVEHVLVHCPRYRADREVLIRQLQGEKVVFNVKNMPQLSTGEVAFNHLYRFLKNTGLIDQL